MKKNIWTKLAACAVALGFVAAVSAHEDEKEHQHAEVGKAAPQFTLTDLEGKEHKLADLKGKVVVLEWTNCECPFVVRHQKEKHTMQNTVKKFEGKDVVWLAIDSTRPDYSNDGHKSEEVKKWASDVELNYPVLLDPEGKVGQMYGAKTTPHMFVIDKEGKLVYAGAIDDDPRDSKEKATNYVEEAVNAVLNGKEVATSQTQPYGCGVKYNKG